MYVQVIILVPWGYHVCISSNISPSAWQLNMTIHANNPINQWMCNIKCYQRISGPSCALNLISTRSLLSLGRYLC